jgi:tetratricopeptide (TPR) repeat protein
VKSVEELLAEAERAWHHEPARGVGVGKAAALLAAALPEHRGDVRLATKLMMYTRMAGRPRSAMHIGREVAPTAADDRDFAYEYGVDSRLAGLWRQAMEVHHRLAAQHRQDPDAQYAWAISQTVYGMPDHMLPVLDELLRREPQSLKYRHGRARVLARLGRLREAVDELERILRADPTLLDGWVLLGRVARQLHWDDRWKAAAAHIVQTALPARAALWSFYLAADRGEIAVAQEELTRAIELDGDETGEPYAVQGRFLFELYQDQGDEELLKWAQKSLELATTLAPDDGEALGRLLELQVTTKRGTPDLRAAMREAEKRPHAGLPRFLGRIVARADAAKAEPLYRLWLEACVEDVEGWTELGDVLTDLERWKDAEAAFARAVELSPQYAAAWNGLGFVHLQSNNHAAAAEAYAKAIAAGAQLGAVRDARATALIELQRFDEALAELHQALAEELDEPLYRLHQAQALAGAGRTAEARAVVEAVAPRLDGEARAQADELLARLRG